MASGDMDPTKIDLSLIARMLKETKMDEAVRATAMVNKCSDEEAVSLIAQVIIETLGQKSGMKSLSSLSRKDRDTIASSIRDLSSRVSTPLGDGTSAIKARAHLIDIASNILTLKPKAAPKPAARGAAASAPAAGTATSSHRMSARERTAIQNAIPRINAKIDEYKGKRTPGGKPFIPPGVLMPFNPREPENAQLMLYIGCDEEGHFIDRDTNMLIFKFQPITDDSGKVLNLFFEIDACGKIVAEYENFVEKSAR